MTRQEFDASFKDMVHTLGCKVTTQQANLYFDEYGKGNQKDFAHACRELAMGNAGWMPKSEVFRDYVAAAREMRIHQESSHREKLAQNILHRGGVTQGPMDDLFAQCCSKLIIGGKHDAVDFIEGALLVEGQFVEWLQTWRTKDGQVAHTWLKEQLELKRASQGLALAM